MAPRAVLGQPGERWWLPKLPNFNRTMARPRLHEEDVPQFTPELNELYGELDMIVERDRSEKVKKVGKGPHSAPVVHGRAVELRNMYRMGSIGVARHQMDFYYRIASSPSIRTICEVGFNAGHSTALWLSANPTAHVYTWDLFDLSLGVATSSYLKQRFPNRLTTSKGNSLTSIPRTNLPPGVMCDLVHIDGRHSYTNVLHDFYNLRTKSRPHALFIFDDQCDPNSCSSLSIVPYQPTLAVCDMVSASLLLPVTSFYVNSTEFKYDETTRQFALFRLHPRAADVLEDTRRATPSRDEDARRHRWLPCSPLCRIRFKDANEQARADSPRGFSTKAEPHQRGIRPASCHY